MDRMNGNVLILKCLHIHMYIKIFRSFCEYFFCYKLSFQNFYTNILSHTVDHNCKQKVMFVYIVSSLISWHQGWPADQTTTTFLDFFLSKTRYVPCHLVWSAVHRWCHLIHKLYNTILKHSKFKSTNKYFDTWRQHKASRRNVYL